MLDPAACAGMSLGAPRVTLATLAELHQLLTERGFRRSSRDDPTIVQEEQHEELAPAGGAIRGPAPAQHPVRFGKASRDVPFGAPYRRAPLPALGGIALVEALKIVLELGVGGFEALPNWWTPLLSSGGSGKVSNGPGTASFYG
jgi:hypothetical protein